MEEPLVQQHHQGLCVVLLLLLLLTIICIGTNARVMLTIPVSLPLLDLIGVQLLSRPVLKTDIRLWVPFPIRSSLLIEFLFHT